MSKKKVTAPLTYNPGKGRPKEHLAYLNWQEMQELQRINGGNMERGPKGLPSFPPKGAMSGSSAKSPASTSKSKGAGSAPKSSTTKATTNRSGPGSTGGSKTPARASSYGRTVESSRGGAQKSAAQKAGMNARDAQFKQVAESTRASSALKKSPAGSDLTKGGIKTLNVGPMGTPVNVKTGQTSGQIKGAISRVAQTPVKSPMAGQGASFGSTLDARIDTFQRINDARLATKKVFEGTTPRAPQGVFGPRAPVGTGYLRTATMPGMITTGMISPYSGVAPPRFNAEQTLRAYEAEKRASVKDQSRLPTASPTLPSLSRPSYETRTPSAYTGYGAPVAGLPAISRPAYDTRAPSGYTGYGAPVPTRVTRNVPMDPSVAGRLAEAEANYKMVTAPGLGGAVTRVYADPDIARGPTFGDYVSGALSDLGTSIYNRLGFGTPESVVPGETIMSERAPSDIIASITGVPGETEVFKAEPKEIRVDERPPYSGAEKILGIETLPDEVAPTLKPGLTRMTNIFAVNPRTLTEDIRRKAVSAYEGLRPKKEDTAAGVPGPETPETDFVGDGVANRSLEPGDVYGPKFVDPEIQDEMRRQDKLNRAGIRVAKSPITGPVGRVFTVADALRKVFTGKTTAEATADLKRAYMQASPTQRAELEKKYPNLTKFASDAGIEPQLPMSNYTDWSRANRLAETSGGGRGQGMSGGIADITSTAGTGATSPATPSTASTMSARPYIYYEWDLGINVPSPGEPKYTEYQKYLQERADAQKALGLV